MTEAGKGEGKKEEKEKCTDHSVDREATCTILCSSQSPFLLAITSEVPSSHLMYL